MCHAKKELLARSIDGRSPRSAGCLLFLIQPVHKERRTGGGAGREGGLKPFPKTFVQRKQVVRRRLVSLAQSRDKTTHVTAVCMRGYWVALASSIPPSVRRKRPIGVHDRDLPLSPLFPPAAFGN